MPEILLPTASKQHEIHEVVKQLKENSGVGKKYIPKILIVNGSGTVDFKGVLDGITFTFKSGSPNSYQLNEFFIDDISVGSFSAHVSRGHYLNISSNVRERVEIKTDNTSSVIYLTCRVEVPE